MPDGINEQVPERHLEHEHRVTLLELFFDLIFVFAITQVTGFLASDLSLAGMARGAMLIAALWWAWVAYSWLTNALSGEDAAPRVTLFLAMGAMLVASLAVPRAFGADAMPFAAAYLVVRVLHVLLYYLAARRDQELRRGVVRLAPALLAGSVLLVVAALTDGAARMALWGAALLVDYAGPLLTRARGSRVHAGHFVERYGLIVIIALGSAIVSVGVGAAGLSLQPGVLTAALLAVVIAGALWWAYFDLVALEAEHRLTLLQGPEQVALARDAYAYLHLLMVAGIVFFALGVKTGMAHVDHALEPVTSLALYGGVALYFIGHLAFRMRSIGSVSRYRVLVVLLLAGGAVAGSHIPVLLSLGLVAGLCTALVAWETVVYRGWRERMRHHRA